MVAFGLTYLFRKQFMPYHGVALGKSWVEVPKELQTLILALMRAVAGGTLAVAALALIVLLIPFRAGVVWAFWAVPASGMILSAGSLYAMRLVAANTPGQPPFKPVLVAIALSIIGLVLSLASGEM
jgi:hypothetical protein